jgi:hypothetical protein
LAIEPLVERSHRAEDRLAALIAIRDRLAERAAAVPQLEELTEKNRSVWLDVPGLIVEEQPGQATAVLQTLVRDVVARSDGQLFTILALPAQPDGTLTRAAIRFEAVAPAHRIGDLLLALRRARSPVVFLDNVELRVADGGMRRGEAAAPVRIRSDVVAYLGSPPR